MLGNIKKISLKLNFQNSDKVLIFKKEKNIVYIKGFFGSNEIIIPKGIFFHIENNTISLYTVDSDFFFKKVVKPFYNNFIFLCYGVVSPFFFNLNIKGIGRKFGFKDNNLIVYRGSIKPFVFDCKNLIILTNSSYNNYSICGVNLTFLKNFISKVMKVSKPTKYKAIGIFCSSRM